MLHNIPQADFCLYLLYLKKQLFMNWTLKVFQGYFLIIYISTPLEFFMKKNRFQALLIYLLTLIIVTQSIGSPFVTFTTTNISSKVAPIGSLQGGTIVYIYGSNFNTDPSMISVYFGPYPCNLIAGSSSSETLACMTTKATSPDYVYNQPLTINTQGERQLICASSNCAFTYAAWKTPVVQQLIPKTIKYGDLLYSFGTHRISDPGDARSNGQGQIRDLLINGQTCSRIDVLQRDVLNVDYRDYIACQSLSGQQAGEYNFTERVDLGYANSSVRSYQTSYLTGEKYQVRQAAEIIAQFPHAGGYNGMSLALTLTGHSKNIDSYTCKIAGQNCAVSSIKDNTVNIEVPKYDNSNILFDRMAKDAADITTQQNGFLGSNGFKYWRYALELSKTLEQWVDYFRAGSIGITLLNGPSIHSQIGSPETYGSDPYIEYLQGYLYIPTAGTYSFWGIGDDQLIVNLAKYQGNSNSQNMQTILKIENYYYDHYNPYLRGVDKKYTKTFTQPGYYFVQVISINNGGQGFFKVMMEVPNNDPTFVPANPTWQIDYISIKQSDMKAEIVNVTVVNTALGTNQFKLSYFVDSGNKNYVLQESGSIKANFTADQFRNAVKYISILNDRDLSVTLKMFDSNKLQVVDPTNAVSYEYILTVKNWRNAGQATQLIPSTDGVYLGSSVFITLIQKHSAPIAGTFKLTVNNVPLVSSGTNTAFNYDAYYQIQNALNSYYKSDQITVNRIMGTNAVDSIEFAIIYYGVTQVKEIKFETTNLTGGSNNLFNTNYTVLKAYSTNFYYDPIPFQFIKIAEDKPQLYLTINQIPVVCDNCDFQFKSDLTASILTASLSGYTISFTLSNPNSIFFTLDDIQVTFLKYPCIVDIGGSITAFTCTFPVDANGNHLMPSGKGVPVVHIKQIGYAHTTGVSEIVVSISVTTFVPAVAGPEGDVPGKISGSGFPVDGKGTIIVSLCGNTVSTFTSVTNNQINFVVPAQGTLCSSSSSSLTINGQTISLTFSYDPTIAPLVSSLSISQASPIMKQDITISGSNFESASNLQVFLYNTTGFISYELTVVTATSTSIQCILGGGKTGDYFVRVLNKGASGKALSPTSPASSFKYKIFVESVTPSTGSMGGGYDITIKGRNFATIDSTNVFVGDALNSLCKIKTITSTTIVCTVPSMDSTYTSGTPVDVVVTGRAVEQSSCDGSCGFTFDGSVTNNVTLLLSTTFSVGQTITITGSDLTDGQVYVGDTKVTPITSTSTRITFNYPPLTVGNYDIKIKTGNSFAYPPIPSSVNLWITSGISRSSGSFAGHIISVTGSGMTTSINDGNVFQMVCPTGGRFDLKRINASANLQAFQIPKNPSTDEQTCKVNVTQGTIFKTFGFTYSADQTKNSIATLAPSGDNFYLTKNVSSTRFQTAWAQVLDANGNPTDSVYPLTINSINSSVYVLTSASGYLPAGNLRVKVNSFISGNSVLTGQNLTRTMPISPSGSVSSASYLGGSKQTITGSGFVDIKPSNNFISVCGLRANIISATSSSIVFAVPPLITQQTQQLYALGKPETPIKGTPFGDTASNINLAVDSNTNTFYTSTSNAACFIGVDFGVDSTANITSIAYMGNPNWAITATMINGAVFEGSNNNSTWTEIFKIDNTVHTGWNTWINTEQVNVVYRYVRFRHDATSLCQLAEITFTGQIYSTVAVNAVGVTACDVKIILPGQAVPVTGATINYSADKTSTITQVNPKFGPSIGGTTLTITGKSFGSVVTVTIDGIPCVVSSNTATSITCLTGKRASPPTNGNSFSVLSDGNPVILATQPYLYIDRWSSQNTWGGQALPREGDSVYVPKGMTLLVDTSTPKLFTVIVDGGSIFFSDQKDMTFDASYFLLNGGQFRAGTPQAPYQHKLTFTLYGGYYDKQLPTVGNKMIACRNCKFNMHGIPRVPTWTDLDATISPGQTTVQLTQAVDWNVGETIAVAASGFNHYESQDRVIASKSADNKTLTVTKPFNFRHFSGIETYGGKDFYMRAEVSLLTRNIKMQGDPTSVDQRHGSHLMLTGKVKNGLDASLSYAQFTNCGQPKIVGRYCTHFHMAGQVPKSFVRGISVHHSLARVLTIHGTHYLLVEKNVGYRVEGHNIFVEDGIETKNIIQDNLMISSINSFTMLQSDITTASYWITNPFNTVVRNRAAGGDFYGFWYEIKEHPDGPSATSDICPEGMQLGLSRDNIAHSYLRFGLRIFRLSARQFPCVDTKDESLADPYSGNKAIKSVFSNYTLWKNKQCGFLGQQLGYTTVQNFKTIDSVKGGMQFHKTNFTKEQVVAIDSVIVGYSQGNGPIDLDIEYENARGLIASRTDGLLVKDIQFINFGPTMTPLQSCSECWNFKLWVTGGKTTHFKNITYTNIQGNYIFWEKWRRQIFIDMDGSLTAPIASTITPSIGVQNSGSITPYRPSLMIPNHCHHIAGPVWDNSIYCDQTITLRGILFTNAIPVLEFSAVDIRVRLLSDPYDNFTSQTLTDDDFSKETMIVIKPKSKDIPKSWAMPFATGQYYNIHWKWGLDYTHVAIFPSRLWTDQDGVVLRFNYTDQRQLYMIGKWYKEQIQLPYIAKSQQLIEPSTCLNGEYYHDINSSYLFVCISGRNKTIQEWVDVNGVRCLNACPKDLLGEDRENFTRYWSDVKNWPNNRLPQEGENVTIPNPWNLILDCETPIFNYVQVRGYLIFDQTKDILFQAHYIWVKGKIKIGSKDTPYIYNANIVLHGQKNSTYMVIDADASGNKMMAVTGGLQFYGSVTDNIWNRLTVTAPASSSSITVQDSTGWKIGDEIVIGATYADPEEGEKVTITQINGKVVSFTPNLVHEHYGDTSITVSNSVGQMDTRAGVGLLSRNIKISRGPDADGWGCRVLIYSYIQVPEVITATAIPTVRNGYAILDGVQFQNCGQYDTGYAGLRIQKLGNHSETTVVTSVTRSSLHDCIGICLLVDTSNNVTFDNNVFYWARKFLALIYQVDNYNFTNNFLSQARKRPELNLQGTLIVDDIACYEQYVPINYINGKVSVTKNLAQGCMGEGFVFPFAPCDYLSTYNFYGNTAGSCEIAFMLGQLLDQQCIGSAGLFGYASLIGLMANPAGSHTRLIYTNMIFTDNERGITLRFAHQIDDNALTLKDSYFAGYSRPNCPSCYSDAKLKYCKNGYAVRMFSATISGQQFPLKKKNTGFDVICTQQSYDFKSFFDNVIFENYKYINSDIPYCSSMSVFKRHNLASDGVASAYLTNTKCLNCDKQSWAYFDMPSTSWRGWFGGCGELDCTGPNNYFIHDQDGSFTGSRSQILANNSMIGDREAECTFIPQINGHHCLFEKLAVMEYESIAPDFKSRIMWPVYLKYDGGSWQTVTNGWREWQWMGPEPMNKRLARFWSVVKLHEHYNLTYSSSPPADSRFQIQKRLLPSGNPSDWVIVRIYYPLPNSLEVLVTDSNRNNAVIKPFPFKQNQWENLESHTNECGANNFYYTNGTIQFVLNGNNNCQVRVRLSSFIQISARLNVAVADFFTNNGPTTFLTNICAFLGIDTGRLKIVSVKSGSTEIVALVQSAHTDTETSAQQAVSMSNLANQISNGISSNQVDLGFSVLDHTVSSVIYNPDGTLYSPEQDSDAKLKMIIAVVIPISIVIIGVVAWFCIRRMRSKIYTHEMLGIQSSQIDITEKKEQPSVNLADKSHEKYEMEIIQLQ